VLAIENETYKSNELFFSSSTEKDTKVKDNIVEINDFDDTVLQSILDKVALDVFLPGNPNLHSQVKIVSLFNYITSETSDDSNLNVTPIWNLCLGVRDCNSYIKTTFFEQVKIRITSKTKIAPPESFVHFTHALQFIMNKLYENENINISEVLTTRTAT